ncbi:peptidase inhibitor family I36 protein [Streptomyces sp. NPDC050388]|uniref:peptidase inhibitor family I36 protein n=1 Tax=Streptomyces sp. NPDC050388 TaxID=3155781 RepID=UPI00341FE3A4
MRKLSKALLGAAMTVALAGLAIPSASAATNANDYSRCGTGEFCIFSGYNGGASICRVPGGSHHDVTALPGCLWTGNAVAKSVRNNTTRTVSMYAGTNSTQFKGSSASNSEGNLQGSYKIRSVA